MKTDESETGSKTIEWYVFLDHAHNIIRVIAEKEGPWFVRTLVEGILEEIEEKPDTTA